MDSTSLGLELASLDHSSSFLEHRLSTSHEELSDALERLGTLEPRCSAAEHRSNASELEASHVRNIIDAQRRTVDELRAHVDHVQGDAAEAERHFVDALEQIQHETASQRGIQEERLRAWEELQRRLADGFARITAPMTAFVSTSAVAGVPLHSHAAVELIRARRSLDEVAVHVAELIQAERALVQQQAKVFAGMRERSEAREAVESKSLAQRLASAEAQLDAFARVSREFELELEAAGHREYGDALAARSEELAGARDRLRRTREATFAAATTLPTGRLTVTKVA